MTSAKITLQMLQPFLYIEIGNLFNISNYFIKIKLLLTSASSIIVKLKYFFFFIFYFLFL